MFSFISLPLRDFTVYLSNTHLYASGWPYGSAIKLMIPKWSVPRRHDDCCAREDGTTSEWNGMEHPIIIQWSTSLYQLRKIHLYMNTHKKSQDIKSHRLYVIFYYSSHFLLYHIFTQIIYYFTSNKKSRLFN